MKVRASVKRICDKCKIVRRQRRGARDLPEPEAQTETGMISR